MAKINKNEQQADHSAWLKKALAFSQREPQCGGSPHPMVKVGAILVDPQGKEIARATNRFAHGVDESVAERYADGSRSLWINCAEQLAIIGAARKLACLKGARLYVTLAPCTVCAGLIAESGIREVIVPKDSDRAHGRLKAKWKKSIAIGQTKLQEAGVAVTLVDMGEVS
ncbi:MAG: deaminase [Bdellovibrionales bacterium]|jgi:dCMP deaminase